MDHADAGPHFPSALEPKPLNIPNPKPKSLNPKLILKPYSLSFEACTQFLKPSTLNAKSSNLKPETLNPIPETLNYPRQYWGDPLIEGDHS